MSTYNSLDSGRSDDWVTDSESDSEEDVSENRAEIARMEELMKQGYPQPPDYQYRVGLAFKQRYLKGGEFHHLADTLEPLRAAVTLIIEGHPDSQDYLRREQELRDNPVEEPTWQRITYKPLLPYENLGDSSSLEAALQKAQEAVDLTPEGHPNRPDYLHNLAMSLSDRYHRLGDLSDLEASLQKAQGALDLTREGHPNRLGHLQNLAISLFSRYQRLGDPRDLEDSLHKIQEALDLTPDGNPDRPGRLGNHALFLSSRYERSGDLHDLEAALKKVQEAVDLTPVGHLYRPGLVGNFAVLLSVRYKMLGDMKDLEAALQKKQEVLDLTPEEHPNRPSCLANLAMSLSDRYQRLGDLGDLKAALQKKQEAIDLTPEGHPHRPDRLQNLARSLSDRYQRLGDPSDLEAAIHSQQEALDLTPEGHPSRPEHLQNLAVSLSDRYKRLGDLRDLEESLHKRQEALDLIPEGHLDRPDHLQNLATSFSYRYQRLRDLRDLDAALQKGQEAVDLTIKEHPRRSVRLQNLAGSLILRYKVIRNPEDLDIAFNYYNELDLDNTTSTATRTCIGLANFTAAVEIMEQGLATTFQQVLQLKTDVDYLHPDQAEEFYRLSSKLHSASSPDLMNTAIDLNRLLKEIRKQPGLEYFLLPMPYNILQQASQAGPVVMLNSHEDSCDGIIILCSTAQPIHVPLPQVTLQLLKSHKSLLKELLGHCGVRVRGESAATRLFGNIEGFSPVYQALELHGIHTGRLWWLPTGAFAGLPLHACSHTDNFIHSYTMTLGSLLKSHSRKSNNSLHDFGVVGVTHTGPGRMHSLEGVKQEVHNIISTMKTANVLCLQGKQATVDAVKLLLQNCSWVHLACHGRQNLKDATKSCLLLLGGELELETILRMSLPSAEFVFLAACQTAMGDAVLVNESFHLGGGLIAAGFRGAVGTLWSMDDKDGPLVAESFYSYLFRDVSWGYPNVLLSVVFFARGIVDFAHRPRRQKTWVYASVVVWRREREYDAPFPPWLRPAPSLELSRTSGRARASGLAAASVGVDQLWVFSRREERRSERRGSAMAVLADNQTPGIHGLVDPCQGKVWKGPRTLTAQIWWTERTDTEIGVGMTVERYDIHVAQA
ncbi:CHAT domain-containing protein [Mycena galopus ATCC 62051]|nr:CHAT domain-containing protein [Mycena galopus ATCC 62051]